MNTCGICGSELTKTPLQVAEEMYAMQEHFEYYQCPTCLCLQLPHPPSDLSKYYPVTYHNYIPTVRRKNLKTLRRELKRKVILNHPKWISSLTQLWLSSYELFWKYRRAGLKTGKTVLDIGSGYGEKIKELKYAGVGKVLGIDPFISHDIYDDGELLVKKGTLEEVEGNFDFITLHHSLEHMPDQKMALARVKSLLSPRGRVLVRIPTVSSEAFDEYKEKWYQLDAPRHLFLHSYQSFKLLSEICGLRIVDKWCDSTELQFILSEQYRKGISFFSQKSFLVNPDASGLTRKQLKYFKQRTNQANRNNLGDQVCYVLESRN